MSLMDSIRRGESKTFELKAQLPQNDQIAKTACTAVGLAEPRIREKGDFVDVEFYRPVAGIGKVADTGGLPAEMNDSERLGRLANDCERLRTIISDPAQLKSEEAAILLHLIDQDKVGRKEATELLGLGNTKTYTLFHGLIAKGLIARRGQGRGTYYVLAHPPHGGSNV